MENKTPIEQIKEFIEDELAKRGYHAPLTRFEVASMSNNNKREVLKITSEDFNTIPVLFKRLYVYNFSGSIKVEGNLTKLWIPVHVGWENFNGGHNATSLFTAYATCVTDEKYSRVQFEVGQ